MVMMVSNYNNDLHVIVASSFI